MKKVLFEIAHPKHFHQFKHLISILSDDFKIKIIARDKDVVIKLLKESGFDYEEYGLHGKKMRDKFLAVPNILSKYYKIVKDFNPDLIVSRSSPYAAIVSKISKAKTLVLPDSEVVTFNNKFTIPLSDYIITPGTYELDHGKNHYKVSGFFENSYLHPEYFQPDESVLTDIGAKVSDQIIVIRLVGWFANHDKGKSGFSKEEKKELVSNLSKKGKLFVSGEGKIPDFMMPYQLNIKANKMHSLLHYATLYIGDSQTMATEAALLGTPSIRFNSFVGENDMSNFKILENEYGLLRNVSTFEEVLSVSEEFLNQEKIKEEHLSKSKEYFKSAGDLNKQTADVIYKILESD
jgi:predicted glycosyltransferase